MTNAFKLDQIVSKNKYNKGVAATVRYDTVDLGKPGPECSTTSHANSFMRGITNMFD